MAEVVSPAFGHEFMGVPGNDTMILVVLAQVVSGIFIDTAVVSVQVVSKFSLQGVSKFPLQVVLK